MGLGHMQKRPLTMGREGALTRFHPYSAAGQEPVPLSGADNGATGAPYLLRAPTLRWFSPPAVRGGFQSVPSTPYRQPNGYSS